MKNVYLVGGTMGVGKTTICQQLKRKLPNSVFLDGDWCWDADPFWVTEETKKMVLENKEKKMGIEIQFLDWLQTLHSPIVDKMMLGITHLGDAGIFWIVLAVILLLIPKTRKSGLIVAAALCIDVIVCNGILKNLFARTRPFDVNEAVQLLITAPKDFSFPSGHTAASFAAVAALYFAGKKKLWKVSLVLAVLIAFSRMYLYVHYPTDILGGVLVGLGAGAAGYYLVITLQERIGRRKKNGSDEL